MEESSQAKGSFVIDKGRGVGGEEGGVGVGRVGGVGGGEGPNSNFRNRIMPLVEHILTYLHTCMVWYSKVC